MPSMSNGAAPVPNDTVPYTIPRLATRAPLARGDAGRVDIDERARQSANGITRPRILPGDQACVCFVFAAKMPRSISPPEEETQMAGNAEMIVELDRQR